MDIEEDISQIDAPGKYFLRTRKPPEDPFNDVFLVCITCPGTTPAGGLATGDGKCVVAFSRLCTHLGCHLVSNAEDGVGELPLKDGRIICRCHFSTFDLANQGLPVIGPATAFLPQVKLEDVRPPEERDVNVTRVKLIGWIQEKSVPYGVPYGGTTL